jgi:ABC-2 type transport system permease protein
MRSGLLPVWSLWRRELVRFGRQRNRVIGALGPPLLAWFFIGSGFGRSFRAPGMENGMSYLEYFYPGIVTLVVLFAAIFASISVIEDRRDGFLRGVLATPVPRPAIVSGKLLGGATQAFLQGVLLLALAPVVGMPVGLGRLAAAAAMVALVAVGWTALGFAAAWGTDSTQGYHGVMNLVLMPMWILSGAFFPLTGAPRWLHLLMLANPMTYGVAAVRSAMFGDASAHAVAGMSLSWSAPVVAGFGVVMFLVAALVANRTTTT